MASIVVSKGHRALAYDGGALPFEDGTFDLAMIYQVLINLPDERSARALVREALRVTRPGGTVLLGALPHPAWSGFPTHRRAWWVQAKISARRLLFGQNVVPYFSYDPGMFDQMFRQRTVAKVSYASCRITRKGWNTKYHAILTR
jgi:SAM-dependent methyltransferase